MTAPRIVLSDAEPHATKVAIFSGVDLPTVPPPRFGEVNTALLYGRPAVVEVDGEVMRFRTSPYVPSGQVFVIDTAVLDINLEGLGQ